MEEKRHEYYMKFTATPLQEKALTNFMVINNIWFTVCTANETEYMSYRNDEILRLQEEIERLESRVDELSDLITYGGDRDYVGC